MSENLLENVRRFRKTKKGLITNLYCSLKERGEVGFDRDWLHEFADCKRFDRLFKEWEKSGYRKEFKPSLDRILRRKGYEKNNVQWLTWAENKHKMLMERRSRKGPVLQMAGDQVVARYRGQREAAMKTGIDSRNISAVLMGRRPFAGGYSWVYEDPNFKDKYGNG